MATPIPGSAGVQFSPAGGSFNVTGIFDPSGAPIDVLDANLGFTLTGTVVLPNWLSGIGRVRINADQLGGPFDAAIGETVFPINGSATPADPPPGLAYSWTVAVTGTALPDRTEQYHMGVLFEFRTENNGHTDIGASYDLGVYLVV